MKIALHACCGPCLLEPYDVLAEQGDLVTVVFFNPNIQPREEYDLRRDTLKAHADSMGMRSVELDYDEGEWTRRVGVHGEDRAARCQACYRLRLSEVARWAAEHDHEAIATTLAVSPYQDAEAMSIEGARAAAQAGVEFVDSDFRDRYSEATRRSRELGMYRQNYCGCLLSRAEADSDRERRRLEKRQSRGSGKQAG